MSEAKVEHALHPKARPTAADTNTLILFPLSEHSGHSQKDSPAAKAGIQSGDIITSVNDVPVHDPRELARKIGTMAPGTSVKLGVIHNGESKSVTLTLGTLPNEKQASNEGTKFVALPLGNA